MKKKFLASILALSLLAATTAFSVSAAELNPATPNGNSPLEMTTATIPRPSYTVTIPEKLEFGNLSKSKTDNIISKDVTVTASGVSNLFANQQKLVVTASSKNAFTLKDAAEKSSMPYKIYCNGLGTPLANNGVVLEASGSNTDDTNLTMAMNCQAKLNLKDITKAGNYTDLLTFNIALQEVNL
ncbi:MAG: hypothetical protein RR177_04700 [Oscillospiraceae bacterium]